MRRDEYEQRKQRLETQLREGIALLESAHRQQLRALELVWMTTAEEDLALGAAPAAKPAAVRSEPAAAVPVAPAPPSRRTPWEIIQDLAAALPKVPEVFDRKRLHEALGYEPNRSSLHRILQQLVGNGNLKVERPGRGRVPTAYRKTGADVPLPGM
ncbi:MAG: hypothetical protein ABIS20_01895 [Thermoanaerobaculia bacterium]